MASLAAAAASKTTTITRCSRGYGGFCKRFGCERCLFTLTSYHDAVAATAAVQQSQRRRFFAPVPCPSSSSSSPPLIPHKYRGHLVSTSALFYSTTTSTKCSGHDDDKINKNYQNNNDSPTNGPEAFRRYTELCESLEELRREKERIKSEEMYQAWQKASSKDDGGSLSSPEQQPPTVNETTKQTEKKKKKKKKKNFAAGVAVVQTLAKQTRQEKEQQQRQGQVEAELQAQATKMLRIAALEFDHPEALVTMGNDLVMRVQEQQQLQQDEEEEHSQAIPSLVLKQALELYQRAGELGSEEAWYNQGTLLWDGYPTQTNTDDENSFPIFLRADQDAAMTCFWKAIDLGDAHAMYFVGAQLLSSDDDDDDVHDASVLDEQHVADLKKGLELLERAGTMGHSGALYYLALLHLSGHQALSVPACSPEQFAERLDAAVAAGNADALFLRGHGHYHGENGYKQDYRKAVEDFLKAADAENADAAVSAAAMLHSGSFPGVPQDQQKAFELYQHAGELGSMEGWRNVVACYARGEGVPKSIEMAGYIAKTMLIDEAKKQ